MTDRLITTSPSIPPFRAEDGGLYGLRVRWKKGKKKAQLTTRSSEPLEDNGRFPGGALLSASPPVTIRLRAREERSRVVFGLTKASPRATWSALCSR